MMWCKVRLAVWHARPASASMASTNEQQLWHQALRENLKRFRCMDHAPAKDHACRSRASMPPRRVQFHARCDWNGSCSSDPLRAGKQSSIWLSSLDWAVRHARGFSEHASINETAVFGMTALREDLKRLRGRIGILLKTMLAEAGQACHPVVKP